MRPTLELRSWKATVALAVLGLAVVTSCATANIPAPVTKTNTVRVPALGNLADGTLSTTVSYSTTTASATASTGNTIGLGRGFYFRLRTCVAYHLYGKVPVSNCAERTVDTRASTTTVYTFAPSVTLFLQPRPTTQPWSYFTSYTEVLYLSANTWLLSAHSWPDNELQGAGIAVAAQGQTSATLPANGPVAIDGPFTGAINSGEADSICTAQPVPADGSALPAGVRSTHAAFVGSPTYYEVGLPTGAYAGQAPRGVMLVLHGGGWSVTGPGAVQRLRLDADRWRARGFETVNLTYRACAQSAGDVLWFYDRARTWFGAGAKICAHGISAGGHLSLLIGAYRPDLYCAVSQAGPTDLTRIQDQGVYNPATGLYDSTVGSRLVHNLGAAAFGEENLAPYSPAVQAAGALKNTRVLQGFSGDDPLVPFRQALDLGEAMTTANPAAYVDNLQLAIGTIPFAHGLVTQPALDDFHARERRLVAPITAPTVPLDRR
jgi:acetyl esterase/lipase